MKLGAQIVSGIAVALLFSVAALAGDLALSDNPYSTIIERNAFGLVPIPVPVQVAEGPPPVPPPVITPNGIMSVFGKYQVLFKVAIPPHDGQPASEASHMMSEGEREDDIEVVKIDYDAAMITFNNHGEVQELPLVKAKDLKTSDTGPAMAGGRGLAPRRGNARTEPDSEPSVVVVAEPTPSPAANPGSGFATTSGANTTVGNNAANNEKPQQVTITPAEQIISMEAQRAKWLDEQNPAAAIIPPTPLTSEVTGQGDGTAPTPNP